MMLERFSLFDIKEVILKIIDFIDLKVFVSNVFIFMSWIFKDQTEILGIVYSLIALDTFLGVLSALKLGGIKELSSKKFFRGAGKFFVYLLFLYVSRMIDRTMPLPIASPIMDAFLVTTEAISIFENLKKLGYEAPALLIEKLKSIISSNKKI